ncbi:MAG: response regulator transcription factor [Flavobacteriales bacterium]|nr:response regulator transcription factor [Flavobacteriales bacterium]
MINILIADDHPIFRKGIAEVILSGLSDVHIDDVSNGEEAVQLLLKNEYQFAVRDIDMPEKDGLETLTWIKEQQLATKVIILTMFKEDEIFNTAWMNNVDGFLLKDHSGNEVLKCIAELTLGKRYIGAGLETKMKAHGKYVKEQREIAEKLEGLTQAEKKTLKLVAENNSSSQIADKLFITTKSVENYRSRICKKMDIAPGNSSLIRWALEHKTLFKHL